MALEKAVLSSVQWDTVRQTVAALRDGRQTLLGHVESERARLTSRDAEERSAALNELCAAILQLVPTREQKCGDGHNANMAGANDTAAPITRDQIDQLLPFLLSKVEDCGHLSDMLITTLHRLIKLYDGVEHVLPNECLDQTITALFEGGGSVQSYGQRDRLLLFSSLDHLVATHGPLLRSLVGTPRVLLAFVRAAQGEREPRALARMFVLHQRMSANFSDMGVLAEDMFELVACYFPIDYEPSDQELAEPMPITREQLRHACECALLGHAAFVPFCMQLIAEKLLETEGDESGGNDGDALIRRQLEICQFFTRAGTKFRDAPNCAVHEHVDDLMTAVRLLFLNPSVRQCDKTLLGRITTTVAQMLRVLASTLEHNAVKLEDPIRFIRLMAETTLENVEPFVLQAEMGTAGPAFCLLRCVSLAHPLARGLCVPRALYWLNTLIRGQTLRSADNRADIATEALAMVPDWLRLCFVADDGTGVFGGVGTAPADAGGSELVTGTVVPLLDAVRSLHTICEPDVLLAAECEAYSVLLLSFGTVPSSAPSSPNTTTALSEQQIAQLSTMCAAIANRVVLPLLTATETLDDSDNFDALIRNVVQQQTDTVKWGRLSAALKQFIALSAHLTAVGDRIYAKSGEHQLVLPDPKKWPRFLELVPALLGPLPAELEQRKMLRKPLGNDQKFTDAVGSLLLSSLFGTDPIVEACAWVGLREMTHRLALLVPSSTEDANGTNDNEDNSNGTTITGRRHCFAQFVEQQLISFVGAELEHNSDQMVLLPLGTPNGENNNNKIKEGWHHRADRLAQLLQDIVILAKSANTVDSDGLHARMCAHGLRICQQRLAACEKNGDDGDGTFAVGTLWRALRSFWLLFLTATTTARENVPTLKRFAKVLTDSLMKSAVVVGTPSSCAASATTTSTDQQQWWWWLINALLCVHFALINRPSSQDKEEEEDQHQQQQANNVRRGTGDVSTPVPPHMIFNQILENASTDMSSLLLLKLRLRAVETRNVLLTEPDASIVAEQLNQFFDNLVGLSDANCAQFGGQAMADLLDLHRPATCPERCNYRRTLFWRQRLFCQFVPIFVQVARSAQCSSTKRRVLLQLLGPLLTVVDPHHVSMDTVLNELGQLHPVIVHALFDVLSPSTHLTIAAAASPATTDVVVVVGTADATNTNAYNDKPIMPMPSSLDASAAASSHAANVTPSVAFASPGASSLSQPSLAPLLLDVLRTLLERLPPGTGMTDQQFVALVPRLVHALTANIATQTLLVQFKALECLRLLALPRLAVPPEALLPLHARVLRTGVQLAASRKRLIRQRMARARNAWELALA